MSGVTVVPRKPSSTPPEDKLLGFSIHSLHVSAQLLQVTKPLPFHGAEVGFHVLVPATGQPSGVDEHILVKVNLSNGDGGYPCVTPR